MYKKRTAYMRKIFYVLLTPLVFVYFAGCGGGSAAQGAVQSAADPITVVMGSHLNPGSPENLAMVWMTEQLAERSNGRFKGEVYESGSIGNEAELVEQVQSGQTHLAIGGSAPQDRYVRKYTVTTIPFMLEDKDVLNAVFDGKIGDAIRDVFAQSNILIPGFSLRGNRQLTTNRKIVNPDDLIGMKMRLPENAV
jgi:TRAP-type C4-dicarboxylate transport system substrate-binding protein